jgi:hypothetical protein
VNQRQLAVLSAGLATLLGILIFPPWVALSHWADGHTDVDPCGRHFLMAAPEPFTVVPELQPTVDARRRSGAILYTGPDSYAVDTSRLIIPISGVCAVTLIGLVLLRRGGSSGSRRFTDSDGPPNNEMQQTSHG